MHIKQGLKTRFFLKPKQVVLG